MKVFYEEGLAYHFGLRRRCDSGNNVVLSVRAGGKRRPAIELRNRFSLVCRPRLAEGKTTLVIPLHGEVYRDTAESENLCMRGNPKRENRELPSVPRAEPGAARHGDGQRTSQRARLT